MKKLPQLTHEHAEPAGASNGHGGDRITDDVH
jgi:hypothetical protein